MTADRDAFHDRIAARHLLPLWVETQRYVPKLPTPDYGPALWKYGEMRELLLEAGEVITEEEANRRVLILQNPDYDGFDGTTRSLYACLQLILPGEAAPEHRHTQTALRLVLEGKGAVTTVNGERIAMAPGDFIVTPSMSWHGHVHEGDGPMIWLDGLDNGLMSQLDTTFFEPGPRGGNEAPPPDGDNLARYGAGLRPFAPAEAPGPARLCAYPYAQSRAALDTLARSGTIDPCHGFRMEHIDPDTGKPPMPTMATDISLLPKGFDGAPYRSTEGAVVTVVEGAGESVVGDETFDWETGDIFVVPSWTTHRHSARTDSVLFAFSDRGVQQALGLWREERV